jgi:hypothetical protein
VIFVSSIPDIKDKWQYNEVKLFLKTFRMHNPKSEIYIFNENKSQKIKILLKKYNVKTLDKIKITKIINKRKKLNNYYSIKPLFLYEISNLFPKSLITWVDIDSVFYSNKFSKYPCILKMPENKYTLENNIVIQKMQKLFKVKVKNLQDISSAIFTFDKKLIHKYYFNFMSYYKYLIKYKSFLDIIYKDISINHLETTLEEFSFSIVCKKHKITKYDRYHLEYFGKKIRKTISCHDHYHIKRINFYLIPDNLKTKNYKEYRKKENCG